MNIAVQPWQLLLAIRAGGVPQVGGLPHRCTRVAWARSRTSRLPLVVLILPADEVFGIHRPKCGDGDRKCQTVKASHAEHAA
jgi:hypothetical protein